jgi:superfamily I DNA/RNA helicase
MTEEQEEILAELVVPYARKYWADVIDVDGVLPYTHDHYLKQWAMSEPHLPYDYILFDEAQDADPLTSSVVKAQTHAQVVAVGDRSQAIYAWRGAIDAMDAFGGTRTALTQSFRFGHEIAEFANVWLRILDADIRVRGSDKPSSVHKTNKRLPEGVLCRTNSGVIGELVTLMEADPSRRIAIGGKGKAQQLKSLAEAADQLITQKWTYHPDLDTFKSWGDVVKYCEDDDGADLKPLVDLVEKHGPKFLIHAIGSCVEVQDAETTISTAHVAKGLEWFHVRISDDFRPPKRDEEGNAGEMLPSDAMLAYVASTRAMRHLDNSGLEWVFEWQQKRARALQFVNS